MHACRLVVRPPSVKFFFIVSIIELFGTVSEVHPRVGLIRVRVRVRVRVWVRVSG